MTADVLQAFEKSSFTFNGETKTVWRAGSGPGIVVMTEMPGITPDVAAFAQKLVDNGYTVAMPHLFGEDGKTMTIPYVMKSITTGCVSKEFTTWAANRTSPVIEWLRALARDLAASTGGRVGAIGMCFTGGFALAMAVDDELQAPVLSQPSLPFGVGKDRKRSLGMSDEDLQKVAARSDLCVLAMRFTGDRMVPAERFEHLREVFGDRVITIEIPSHKGNEHGIPAMAHSVCTEHYVDDPGHPTHDAVNQLLDFFKQRLNA